MAHLGRSGARGTLAIAIAIAAVCVLAPGVSLAAFPGTNPAESPRANTPNDPEFDNCEPDDPDGGPPPCSSYFSEQFKLFGFSPESANLLPLVPHNIGATPYLDCSQLDAQGQAANVAAGDPACSQIAGVRADTAWKYSPGSPRVSIAILDTGIRWQDRELRRKVRLNVAELPTPQHDRAAPVDGGGDCVTFASADDADGDGAVNVMDFRCDTRVAIAAGDGEADSILDGSDLIGTFSEGGDSDSNGYADDIAGWDFFDDDNDPFDASSCCSANGHGTGRAKDAAADTNNGIGGAGMCPECQVMPLRVWDSFVVPIDNFALGVVYAADNGAKVVEGAVGGLGNTQFARRSFSYADSKGVALMLVSSDINSANHNYPTNYNEAVYVAGAYPDTAPNETCAGPGSLPGVGDVIPTDQVPPELSAGCQQLFEILGANLNIFPTTQPPTTSFFRNSNLTQYGGKADIVLEATTGSENTGMAAGAAGLLASFAIQTPSVGGLSGNEIRQLLTMSAEDVKPANTGVIGLPDKASPGWDPHFGYGRVNLAAAMKRIADDRVPPEAQINSPDWFSPINLDDVGPGGVEITGHAASPHGDGVGAWELEYACGQDALDSSFQPLASGSGPVGNGALGTISKAQLQQLADSCDGSVAADPGRPGGTLAEPWPADPYPSPDPERHAFQVRLTVHEAGDASNFGRYRKTLFAYNDDGNLPGWPKAVGSGAEQGKLITASGGEVSPRLYDLDGDNELDVLLATTSGELHALHADGSPVQSFNGGQPVLTPRYALEERHPVPGALPTPRESPRVPAIGDIDGDQEAEIVVTAGEHVAAWNLDGSPAAGFPVRLDPSLSAPCVTGAPEPCFDEGDRAITGSNHIKRGFFGAPALADLDCDGRLDVVAAAMDQHLYAWDGDGDPLPGYDPPVKLASPGADGAEIIASPAIGELDGRGCDAQGDGPKGPEVIVSTNEVVPGDPQFPDNVLDLFNALLESATGSNPVYAVHANGDYVDGWPVGVGVAAGDLLPMVLPGHDSALLDRNGDGRDEVSISAATSLSGLGGTRLVNAAGSTQTNYLNLIANSLDQGPVLNLADYQSIGDVLGTGTPAVIKGGLTLNGAVNLLAVNQNLPFSHVEQAWDSSTGLALPGFPRATDDFQLVAQGAVARVGGAGPGRQALAGTGLYQLHAYGTAGLEPPGWPKFTGGWIQVTPAVGDADGDGDLDVSAVTREGWSFLWNTGVSACSDSNEEWWTYHHDERSSANYGTDGRPPGTPTDLIAARNAATGVDLAFTAPGDDWVCGKAARFRVVVSPNPISKPSDGTLAGEFDATASSGQTQAATLAPAAVAGNEHLAVFYRDEAGNWGHLSDAPVPGGGGGGDSDGDGLIDSQDNCPAIANPDQGDADGNGVGDACESPIGEGGGGGGSAGAGAGTGSPGGGAASAKHLNLKLKRVRREGKRACFRATVSGPDGAPVAGAKVTLGGAKKLTKSNGRARICRRARGSRVDFVQADAAGFEFAVRKVRIRRR